MRIIITGAAGLVGLHLIDLLKNTNHQIIAIDQHSANLALAQKINPSIETHCFNLCENPDHWPQTLDQADIVIALHAQITSTQIKTHRNNNVLATQNLLKVCQKNSQLKHFIYLSSSVVLAHAKDPYTLTKKEGQEAVIESGLPYTILQPPLMYGVFEKKHLGNIVDMMQRYPIIPFPGHGRYARQALYAEDLCRVIKSCIQQGPSQNMHSIIGHETIDFIDLVTLMAQKRHARALLCKIPLPLFHALLKIATILKLPVPFNTEQLQALTAGDHFEIEPWTDLFNVSYTSVEKGFTETIHHPLWKYRSQFQFNQSSI